MPEKTISILPISAYNAKNNSSRECEQRLKYIAHKTKATIRNAKNGGEVKIGRYFVDGYDGANKIIYEYKGKLLQKKNKKVTLYLILFFSLGCCWHSCSVCYTDTTFLITRQKQNLTLIKESQARIDFIYLIHV